MIKTAFKVLAVLGVFAVRNSCFAQVIAIPANSQPNAFSSAAATSGSYGQPNFSFSPSNTFSPSAASASASASSQSSSALDTFTSTFTNAIQSSPVLADAFDLSQTSPKSFADFVSHGMHSHFISRGISDPSDIAIFVTQPIANNFKVITYPVLVRINANAMGKLLLAEGILNDMNAASLASAFANEMENSARRTVDKSFQESKFQALADGYVGFMRSHGLYTREKLPAVAKYYGNEVRLVGGQLQ